MSREADSEASVVGVSILLNSYRCVEFLFRCHPLEFVSSTVAHDSKPPFSSPLREATRLPDVRIWKELDKSRKTRGMSGLGWSARIGVGGLSVEVLAWCVRACHCVQKK